MKTFISPNGSHPTSAGSALMMTVILALCLGIVLGSYLYLTGTQTNLVAESQAWNTSLAYAEAGIEEGMAQLNVSVGTPNPLNYTNSIASNFGSVSGPWGPKSTSIDGGSYSLIVSNDYPPTLYSTGSNEVSSIGRPVTRTVCVKTSIKPLFGNAIAAIQNVDGKGNNVTIDAYDSFDTIHFTNGMYNPYWAMAGADVATTSGIINAQNANIYGHLLLGPNGTATINANGRVGDLPVGNPWGTPGWSGTSGIEPGWIINDFNMDFPDVVPPYTSGLTAPDMSNKKNLQQYVLNGYDYYMSSDPKLQTGDSITVTNGNARLYIADSFTMAGGSEIDIAQGATLKIYIGNPSGAATSGGITTVNVTGNAANFQIYGLPTTTALTWTGNAAMIGTVYAPEAAFTLAGGGSASNPTDYMGSCVAMSVTINGHFNLHFDMNLKRTGPPSGYALASWTEL